MRVDWRVTVVAIIGAASSLQPCAGAENAHPLARWRVDAPALGRAASSALAHLTDRVRILGGPSPTTSGETVIWLSLLDRRRPRLGAWDLTGEVAPLKPWQRAQCFAIASERPGEILVGALAQEGLAHALSELELRLRPGPIRVDLAEPRVFEAPAIEERGEYINVGYDIPGITPHQWGAERWRAYIDLLALAKLNRLYFFLWGSDVTAWPASTLSKSETSRRLYAELPRAIRYAQSRGMKVTLMLGPTMIPRDVWQAHPDWHADIEYVKAGFPVVCPSVPAAWDAVMASTRAQLQRLRAVDAVQIWFYDPGGCWCEKNGCKTGQAASLARQVVELSALYKSLNRRGRIEVNLWPLSLWEHMQKLKVRDDLDQRIMAAFPQEYREITMVGTPEEGPTPTPKREKALGFRTGLFLFAANPESNYAFPTPHLRYMPWAAQVARDFGVDACFGHRLEVWTRYAGTFIMSELLWNPDRTTQAVVGRFSDWQTGSTEAGSDLAKAITLLDRFTDDGADPKVGRDMRDAVESAWAKTLEACKPTLLDMRAIINAMAAIGDTVGVPDDKLAPMEERFGEALRQSPTLAPLAKDAAGVFKRYRGLLVPGWRKLMF